MSGWCSWARICAPTCSARPTASLKGSAPQRVRDLPLSEAGSIGLAAGAAMAGLRPVVDLTVASFVFGAMDQFVSQLAKARYMFGGQARLPVVIRAALYYHGGTAGHHADRPYPMFMNVPGLKIIVPSNATDLKGLLKSAIRDDNPVLCFEDANLWGRKGRAVRPARASITWCRSASRAHREPGPT